MAGASLAAVPFLRLPSFYESFLYLILHWIVLATSWNILSGYSGYFSFGHGAFYGIGVYTTAVLAGKYDVPFVATLPLAALVAALLGVALGAVVFRVARVRGELFALLTLAVTFVLATIVLNTPIDGGPGVYLSAVPIPALAPTASGTFYLLALGLAIVTLMLARAIPQARLGIGLFAIHDDEDAAEVIGVPTYRYKLIAFGISSALAGAAGGIQALFVSYVTANSTFNITVPLTVILMSVLGGTRHWAGPAIGATAITLLLYASTAADQAVTGKAISGAILVAAVLFMPNGILELVRTRWPQRLRGARIATTKKVSSSGADDASPVADAIPAAPHAHRAGPAPFPSAHATVGSQTSSATDEDSRANAGVISGRVQDGITRSDTSAAGASLAPMQITPIASGSPADAVAPLLRVRGLSKAFKGVQALDDLNLHIDRGEILGIIGPNGSGKSTLINVVSGHYAADTGSLRFAGEELIGLPAHRIARAGISRTYQIPRAFAHLQVRENVALSAMFGRAALDGERARRAADEWLTFTGLATRANALPGELNLHQTKFLELARALAARPRLLLLDEVLSGLTPSEIEDAVDLIRSIRAQGTTIVLVEHVMRIVTALSDRIIVLDQGRLLAEGDPAEVMAREDVAVAYLGARRA